MTDIIFKFENCENITVPKKYIKSYHWEKDSSGKLTSFEIVFKRGMLYTENWFLGIPKLDEEINKNPPKRQLFKRISSGDICYVGIKESPTDGEWFEVPIEPNTDVFYNPNPWQIWNPKTKTLTIKNPEDKSLIDKH